MSRNGFFLFALALALGCPAMALAQHNRGAVHSGGQMPHGGGMHPGQQGHAGMVSPEQQMMHEWMRQQMMLNEMMRSHRASGNATHSRSNAAPANPGRTQPAGNGTNRAAKTNAAKTSTTTSPGQSRQKQQSNQATTKHAKQEATKNHEKEPNHEKHAATAKTSRSTHKNNTQATRAVDSRAVGLLKNAHAKLRQADADYQGHRIRAMDHVMSAIHRLDSISGLTGGGEMGGYYGMIGSGGGNLPQGQSDQLLRDALVHLNQTQGMLGTGTTAAEHHRNAHAAVSEAIHQVEVALKIR